MPIMLFKAFLRRNNIQTYPIQASAYIREARYALAELAGLAMIKNRIQEIVQEDME